MKSNLFTELSEWKERGTRGINGDVNAVFKSWPNKKLSFLTRVEKYDEQDSIEKWIYLSFLVIYVTKGFTGEEQDLGIWHQLFY